MSRGGRPLEGQDTAADQHSAEELAKESGVDPCGQLGADQHAHDTSAHEEGDGKPRESALSQVDGEGGTSRKKEEEKIDALGGELRKVGDEGKVDHEKAASSHAHARQGGEDKGDEDGENQHGGLLIV